MRRDAPGVRAVCAAAVVIAAVLLLRRALAGIDLQATLHAVVDAGRWAPLALVPFVGAVTLDAIGMRILLASLGRSVPLARLVPIRIATEALHLTAPAGFLVADSASAALLDTRCAVPVSEGAVIAIARKWLVMRAHGAYIVLGATGGSVILTALSVRWLGGRWLPWAVAASALLPLGLSLGMGAGFRGRPALERLQGALGSIAWPGARERILRWKGGATRVDTHLARIGGSRSATWLAAASFFGAWLCESLETCLIIRLVGGPLDLRFAMAAEVGLSLVRSIGNVAPAGLGVQDASYAMLLQAMGLPGSTTAAFVLLKRGKELAWIVVGYSLLAAMRRHPLDERSRVGATLAGRVASASGRLVRRVA